MDYSFNERVAMVYGVENAVLIQNIYWWTQKNKANGSHFYEGRYWTYNSTNAFAMLFKFWTVRQVRAIIENCEKKGALMVGNFNKSGYNRTKWYALSDDCAAIYVSENLHLPKSANASAEISQCISGNGQMDVPESANGFAGISQCITDNNTYINHIENTDRASALKFLEVNCQSRLEAEMMKYKTDIGTDYAKFCADFDAKVTIELEGNKLPWTANAIIARLGTYARTWISNNANKAKGQANGFNGQQPEKITRNKLV